MCSRSSRATSASLSAISGGIVFEVRAIVRGACDCDIHVRGGKKESFRHLTAIVSVDNNHSPIQLTYPRVADVCQLFVLTFLLATYDVQTLSRTPCFFKWSLQSFGCAAFVVSCAFPLQKCLALYRLDLSSCQQLYYFGRLMRCLVE